MCDCCIKHIPTRLHSKDKLQIDLFEDGELLYRRCSAKLLENPYATISLTELSHNRSGHKNEIISNRDDVLYNIVSETPERYSTYENGEKIEVCVLKVKNPDNTIQYIKHFGDYELMLLHDPVPCMYPHCIFRIAHLGTKVTFENYKDTLKKDKIERNQIRHELSGMIIREEIEFPTVEI